MVVTCAIGSIRFLKYTHTHAHTHTHTHVHIHTLVCLVAAVEMITQAKSGHVWTVRPLLLLNHLF